MSAEYLELAAGRPNGLCSRCGVNIPLPNDPDDFCSDCALEAELIVAEIEERKKCRCEKFSCVGVCECGGSAECLRCNR